MEPDLDLASPLEDVVLRPLLVEDLPEAGHLGGHRPDWTVRSARLLAEDAAGCWALTHRGALAGYVTSLRRGTLWCLADLVVDHALRGHGLGRALLDRAATHGDGALRRMASVDDDQWAIRLHHTAGFDLHPTFEFTGRVDGAALRRPRHVRDGTVGDREWMDSLDRMQRGAAHSDGDHRELAGAYRLRVVDRHDRRGYAYVGETGTVTLLNASDRRTARDLFADALLSAPGATVRQGGVTAANQWALDIALEAGLRVGTRGHLAVPGMRPPTPYVHHRTLL